MAASRLTYLFYRYFDNLASGEETAEFLELLAQPGNEESLQELMEEAWDTHTPEDRRIDRARGLELLEAALAARQPGGDRVVSLPRRPRWPAWARIAAAVLVLAGTAVVYRLVHPGVHRQEAIARPVIKSPVVAPADYTRQYRLPDGSVVVLRAGSHLDMPTAFAGATREVGLTGEAYFDVAPDPTRPFIIHTAGIRTTVLGTAFDIRASSEQVVVAVTKGRVKVEKGGRLLAVLEPDHQVTYTIPSGLAEQQHINAKAVVSDWTRQDMVFEQSSFGDVAAVLSRRYGAVIEFRNPRLRACKIKAYFNGTEPLVKVLELLCTISNAQYTRESDGKIIIDGPGCS